MNLACRLNKIFWVLIWSAKDGSFESMSVLHTHKVVENGVEGGGEIVEEAREVH